MKTDISTRLVFGKKWVFEVSPIASGYKGKAFRGGIKIFDLMGFTVPETIEQMRRVALYYEVEGYEKIVMW